MDALALDKLSEIVARAEGESYIEEVGGVHFHVNRDEATPLSYPKKETLKVFSLKNLVNFIHAAHDALDSRCVVNVDDFNEVSFTTLVADETDQRHLLAKADFSKMFDTFPFGQQLSQEDFVIKLLTKFQQTPERDELLKTVSSVRAEKVSTSDDDGYSQVAAVKAGVHLTETKKVVNLHNLTTFMTFPEIEQPVIPYILRLHQKDDETPKFSLHPCDGGLWKVKVAATVRDWVDTQLKTLLAEKYGEKVVLL